MKFNNNYKSPNFNNRKQGSKIKYIIIHYTAMLSDIEALDHLCKKENKVSSHFLINKSGDIYQLVEIKYRAWHAGLSYWKAERDINSHSIGIEIDYKGSDIKNEAYTEMQIDKLSKLLKYLKKKYSINSNDILGHSDISPYRKMDPGKDFPWKILNYLNLCYFPKKISTKNIAELKKFFEIQSLNSKNSQSLYMLSQIGYDINRAKKNKKNLSKLIKIYQSHYRNSLTNGLLDEQTYNILLAHFKESLTI